MFVPVSSWVISSAYLLQWPSDIQHTPDWLEEPFDLDEVIRPPSYLYASLQQALSESPYDQHPPAYEHAAVSPNAVAGPSRYLYPPARHSQSTLAEHDSIWEDWDSDEESDGAEDADDERERDADTCDGPSARSLADSDGGSTLLNVASQGPSPDFSPLHQERPPDLVQQQRQESPRPVMPLPSPPPAYHLLYVHTIMENVAKAGVDPYTSLVPCLSGLDAQLLAQPFAAFAEVCYHDAIRGDNSPPTDRPFSPPPRSRTAPIVRSPTQSPPPHPVASGSGSGSGSSSQASSSTRALALALQSENVDNLDLCPPLALADSDGEEEEAEEPRSPLATFMAPPLVYDGRADENSRPLPFDGMRCMSPVSMSLMFASEEPPGSKSAYRPARSVRAACCVSPIECRSLTLGSRCLQVPDPAAEVACLFLSAPVPSSAGAAVQCFPTRPPPTPRPGGGGMRNMLLRSFNFNRM
ncbi:hypothetical protein EIP86_010107 [Pleurotus ostreatoroseus]|nr:hypothetical protein EIP86_010107 [Pleurotus ostreatoroseus]